MRDAREAPKAQGAVVRRNPTKTSTAWYVGVRYINVNQCHRAETMMTDAYYKADYTSCTNVQLIFCLFFLLTGGIWCGIIERPIFARAGPRFCQDGILHNFPQKTLCNLYIAFFPQCDIL